MGIMTITKLSGKVGNLRQGKGLGHTLCSTVVVTLITIPLSPVQLVPQELRVYAGGQFHLRLCMWKTILIDFVISNQSLICHVLEMRDQLGLGFI